jgi:hypothetical protein
METLIVVVAGEIPVGNNRVTVVHTRYPHYGSWDFGVSVESGCGRDTLWPDRVSAVNKRRDFLSMSGIVLGVHGQSTLSVDIT